VKRLARFQASQFKMMYAVQASDGLIAVTSNGHVRFIASARLNEHVWRNVIVVCKSSVSVKGVTIGHSIKPK